MVAGDVLEVLAEERTVEKGYDAAVRCQHLCALIRNAVHLSAYAVTFDVVAHTHSSRHKGDAVEEVLEEVLHGETHTGGKTCRNNGHCR